MQPLTSERAWRSSDAYSEATSLTQALCVVGLLAGLMAIDPQAAEVSEK